MERVPDNEVMLALDRRNRFPVAVVVMVHDNISILRSSLEGVAVVVEHIVSENECKLGNVPFPTNERSPCVTMRASGKR